VLPLSIGRAGYMPTVIVQESRPDRHLFRTGLSTTDPLVLSSNDTFTFRDLDKVLDKQRLLTPFAMCVLRTFFSDTRIPRLVSETHLSQGFLTVVHRPSSARNSDQIVKEVHAAGMANRVLDYWCPGVS
jgi:hypothetical protein